MIMGVSYYVQGLKPITDDYKKRLEILNACKELKITPPKEILDYFEHDSSPCEDGIVVSLKEDIVNKKTDRYHSYLDVDISKLPKGVTTVRFVCSY